MKKLISIFATIAMLAVVVAQAAGNSQLLIVEGMTCGGCEKPIRAAFTKLPEVKSVAVDVKKGTVELELEPEKSLTEEQIRATVKAAGYKVTKVSPPKSS